MKVRLHTETEPIKHIPEHNKTIRHNIRNSKVKRLDRIILDEVLEDHNRLQRSKSAKPPNLHIPRAEVVE